MKIGGDNLLFQHSLINISYLYQYVTFRDELCLIDWSKFTMLEILGEEDFLTNRELLEYNILPKLSDLSIEHNTEFSKRIQELNER